uniref:Uncharacterized protein n=1 Tax=Pararge aegeria TaxID=116150 RepID=S4NZ03_9NEOP
MNGSIFRLMNLVYIRDFMYIQRIRASTSLTDSLGRKVNKQNNTNYDVLNNVINARTYGTFNDKTYGVL